MTDPIEGEIVTEQRGLATVPQVVGVRALAELGDAEFERNLRAIRTGQDRVLRMQKELLVDGVDYGNVPGVDKPSLAKPGAEKLCLAYGLVARVETQLTAGDGESTPRLTYDATCWLHVGSFDGPVVGMGHGTCSSFEVKYRYRSAERICPKCSKPTIIKGKEEFGGGWLCFAKKGGCGAKFGDKDPVIVGQQVGQMDNPDPHDLANTLMKMAEKRAHVDATLRTTGASGIFTQDMEENAPAEAGPRPEPAARPTRERAMRTASDAMGAAVSSALSAPAKPAANEPPQISDAELDTLAGAATAIEGKAPDPLADAIAEAGMSRQQAQALAERLFPAWLEAGRSGNKRPLNPGERTALIAAIERGEK